MIFTCQNCDWKTEDQPRLDYFDPCSDCGCCLNCGANAIAECICRETIEERSGNAAEADADFLDQRGY